MRAWALVTGLVLAACAGGGAEDAPAPDRDAAPPAVIPDAAVLPQKIHPQIAITAPARASFVGAEPTTLVGATRPGSAPIAQVEVEDVEVTLGPAGDFAHALTLSPGPNLLGVRAQALDRGRAVDAVTVFAGDTWPPGATLPGAMHFHLGPEFLDDDDDDLDDVARIIELVLADPAFVQSLTAEPFEFGGSQVTVTRADIRGASVDLTAGPGCISATLSLGDDGGVTLDFEATGSAALLGALLHLEVARVVVDAQLCPDPNPEVFDLQIVEPTVRFTDFLLSTDRIPDLATDNPGANEALQGLLEELMTSWASDSLGALVLSVLESFQLEYTFGGVTAAFHIEGAQATSAGLELSLAARFEAPLGLPQAPPGAGSLRTDDPPPGLFSRAPLGIALSDDAINQLLFAVWWSGATDTYALDPAALSELPEVFQPITQLDVRLGLPPTLVPATEPEFQWDMATGEIAFALARGDGASFAGGLHVQGGVALSVSEDGAIAMALDDRAQRITVHANVSASPPALDRGDVAALLRLMVPTVLSQAQVAYAGFPLPAIELSRFSEAVPAFRGRAVSLEPARVRKVGAGGGYLVVEGAVREVGPE